MSKDIIKSIVFHVIIAALFFISLPSKTEKIVAPESKGISVEIVISKPPGSTINEKSTTANKKPAKVVKKQQVKPLPKAIPKPIKKPVVKQIAKAEVTYPKKTKEKPKTAVKPVSKIEEKNINFMASLRAKPKFIEVVKPKPIEKPKPKLVEVPEPKPVPEKKISPPKLELAEKEPILDPELSKELPEVLLEPKLKTMEELLNSAEPKTVSKEEDDRLKALLYSQLKPQTQQGVSVNQGYQSTGSPVSSWEKARLNNYIVGKWDPNIVYEVTNTVPVTVLLKLSSDGKILSYQIENKQVNDPRANNIYQNDLITVKSAINRMKQIPIDVLPELSKYSQWKEIRVNYNRESQNY